MLLSILLGIIGTPEIIVIIALVLLLFGGRKIPELMKGLGKGMKEFKKATSEDDDDDDDNKSKKDKLKD